MDQFGFEQFGGLVDRPRVNAARRVVLRDRWVDLRTTLGGHRRARRATRTGRRGGRTASVCPAPAAPRPRRRACPRRRRGQHDPTPAGSYRPRDDLHLPAGHRPQRDHRCRPLPTTADHLSHRRTHALADPSAARRSPAGGDGPRNGCCSSRATCSSSSQASTTGPATMQKPTQPGHSRPSVLGSTGSRKAIGASEGRAYELTPGPVQPSGVPLWVGSWGSDDGLARVARLGDGWLASAYKTTPEGFAAAHALLARALVIGAGTPRDFPTRSPRGSPTIEPNAIECGAGCWLRSYTGIPTH